MISLLKLNQLLYSRSTYLQNGKKTNLRFLFLYIIINIFYTTLLYLLKNYQNNKGLYTLAENFPITFLTAPIVYYYFRDEIFKYEKLKLVDLLHFIPLLIYVVYVGANNIKIQQYTFSLKSSIEIHSLTTSSFLYLIRIIQIFSYFVIGIILCYNRYGLNFIEKSKLSIFSPNIFIYLILISLALYPQAYFAILGSLDLNYSLSYSILIILLIGLSIRFIVNKFPQISETVQTIIEEEYNESNKFKKEIILSDSQLAMYSKIINQYISTKPTRDTKFNKNQLVSAVCLPEYLVNCYFNQHLGTSFGNWKTNQRIIDGVDLIQQGFLKSKTIESLAKEVGFSSRSRFVEAFVKIQGCTPTDYHASYFK